MSKQKYKRRGGLSYDNGCWIWTGIVKPGGYGTINLKGRYFMAHRLSYLLYKGVIPQGLVLDHLCRNRACINPDHLEPVTQKENILRGVGVAANNLRKTHCKRGHVLSKDNVYVKKDLARECKVCRRKYQLDRYYKAKTKCS